MPSVPSVNAKLGTWKNATRKPLSAPTAVPRITTTTNDPGPIGPIVLASTMAESSAIAALDRSIDPTCSTMPWPSATSMMAVAWVATMDRPLPPMNAGRRIATSANSRTKMVERADGRPQVDGPPAAPALLSRRYGSCRRSFAREPASDGRR